MAKEFFGVRTDFKGDYKRAKITLGLPTLTDAHEAIMRAVTQPELPQSSAVLECMARTGKKMAPPEALEGKEKKADDCCFSCSREKCCGSGSTCANREKGAESDDCRTCDPCSSWTPPASKGAAKP